MELNTLIKKLKERKEFKEWSAKNPDNFLSYVFNIIENGKKGPWQLGFYLKATDKVTSFIVNGTIKVQEEEEIFKKPDMEVKPIDMNKIKIPFDEILKKASEFQKSKYPKELITKTIAILQNLEGYGTIWNVTCVTQAFRTLNMKINAENGKILHHSLDSLMDFIKK